MENDERRVVFVCGDITVDGMILSKSSETEGKFFFGEDSEGLQMDFRIGSACEIGRTLNELNKDFNVIYPILDDRNSHFGCKHHPKNEKSEEKKCNPVLTRCNQYSTIWTMWDKVVDKGNSHSAYRIKNWMQSRKITSSPETFENMVYYKNGIVTVDMDEISPNILVVKDLNSGFMEHLRKTLRKDTFIDKLEKIIIISSSVSALDKIEDDNILSKTTLIIPISDLRAENLQISHSISWDRLFYETIDAIINNKSLSEGKKIKCKRIVVSLQTSGAITIEKNKTEQKYSLIFDNEGQEGTYLKKYVGSVSGYAFCLLAPIVGQFIKNHSSNNGSVNTVNNGAISDDNSFINSIRIGVILERILLYKGYENSDTGLAFPIQEINWIYEELNKGYTENEFIKKHINSLSTVEISDTSDISTKAGGSWSILESCVTSINAEFIKKLVKNNPVKALKSENVPFEKIGQWLSVDREEIEEVHSIQNAIEIYRDKTKNGIIKGKPLNIAVFGCPGSGKSFAIKEVVSKLDIGKENLLTFNLSQFKSHDDLAEAFHTIRDLNLKGKLPVVFWDEFDTEYNKNPGGWIRYFLSPMQDGEFISNGRIHPIGEGIFVFAGSIASTYYDFVEMGNIDKIKDFQSRLSAFLNVKGLNGSDNIFKMKRALLINSLLKKYHENIIKTTSDGYEIAITDVVIEKLLNFKEYYYGARSMENIIKASNTKNKSRFEISSLPPDNILNMHIRS